ncbi:MAG: hypothetical protein H7Z75_06385 [Ferruginibacter sp.]|nr:hypothetical protein [Cytophagales bacterium]
MFFCSAFNSFFLIPGLLTLLSLVFAFPAFSQVKYREDGQIESAEIVIEKDRKIELPEANRNFEKIPTTAAVPAPRGQDYDYGEKNFRIGDLRFSPRVLQLPTEPLTKLYGNHVRVGVGNYATLNAEGYFNTKRTDDYAYGLRFKHRSSQVGPVDRENSATSANMVGFQGKYFTDLATLSADVQYNRDKYYFYGYRPGTVTSDGRKNIEQVFNTLSFEGRITNASQEAPLDYDLSARFTNLKDHYQASEFDWTTQLSAAYPITDNIKALLNADLYVTKRKDMRGDLSRNLFRFRPYFQLTQDALTVKTSLNVVYENDTVATAKTLHFYPTVDVAYALSDDVTAFGGLDGDLQRTSLRGFVQDNPYLVANVPLVHTNKVRELYAGLRGRANRDVTFELRVATARYRNLYFFNNSASDTSRFTILHNTDVSSVLDLGFQVAYHVSERFRSSLALNAYNYRVRQVEAAWHRPTLTATWINTFNVREKIYFGANFYYLGGIQGKNFVTNRVRKLDPVVDLSLKVDYVISTHFSAFLLINNIFAQKYQRYLYYPQQRLNALVGLTYSF